MYEGRLLSSCCIRHLHESRQNKRFITSNGIHRVYNVYAIKTSCLSYPAKSVLADWLPSSVIRITYYQQKQLQLYLVLLKLYTSLM